MTAIPRTIHHLATNIHSEHLVLCTGRLPDLAVEDTSLVAERITCPDCRRIAGLGEPEPEHTVYLHRTITTSTLVAATADGNAQLVNGINYEEEIVDFVESHLVCEVCGPLTTEYAGGGGRSLADHGFNEDWEEQ